LSETIPPQWSRHSVARRKTPRAASTVLAMAVSLSVIGIDFIWSRHLVFNWGLLGNPGWLVLLEIRG
jgi:hypothetical protein